MKRVWEWMLASGVVLVQAGAQGPAAQTTGPLADARRELAETGEDEGLIVRERGDAFGEIVELVGRLVTMAQAR